MRRSKRPLLPFACLVAIVITLAFPLAFAAAPSFSPSITPTAASTSQPNVSITVSSGTITSDARITNMTIDISGLTDSGHIQTTPLPTCPASLPNIVIENQRILHCYANTGGGINSGSSGSATLTISETTVSGGTKYATVELVDSELNSTTENAGIQIQYAPNMYATLHANYSSNVSKGQTGIQVAFNATNLAASPAAQAVVTSYTALILDSANNPISSFSISPSPIGHTFSSQENRTYTFTVNIPDDAATGLLRHYFNLTVQDPNSNLYNTSSTAMASTNVLSAPNLTAVSVSNSTAFISNVYPYNEVNITISVTNSGQSTANLTTRSLIVRDSIGNDRTSLFDVVDYTNTTQIGPSATRNVKYGIRGNNSGNGEFSVNFTINYIDYRGTTTQTLLGGKSGAFTYDTIGPFVSILSKASTLTGNSEASQGTNFRINTTVSDAGAGISSDCYVLFGGVAASSTLSYSSGTCNGTVAVPLSSSLYDTKEVKIVATDNVGNNASSETNAFIYTLKVDVFDAITGREIQNTSELSAPTVLFVNSSGGQTYSCRYSSFASSDNTTICGVAPGTFVNLTVYSPAYLKNSTNETKRVCVGTSAGSDCLETLPSGGAVQRNITLLPNTEISIRDEFGYPLTGFNITVNDTTGWRASFSDGGALDENSSAGILWLPLDTDKHSTPFTVSFNVLAFNNTGLTPWIASSVTPNNSTLTSVSSVANFTMHVNLLNEFGLPINTSGGSVVYNLAGEFGLQPVACTSKPSDMHVYGCRVPTYEEVVNASYSALGGANITVLKEGYVDLTTQRTAPPATLSSARKNITTTSNFTVIARPRDYYNASYLSNSEVSSIDLPTTGACQYSASLSKWGCPAKASDPNLTVVPFSSAGFLENVTFFTPSSSAQQIIYPLMPFSLQVAAQNEIGGNITSQVSSVSFNSTVSCQQSSASPERWGCKVPLNSTGGNFSVQMASLAPYLSYSTGPISIPSLANSTGSFYYSANKFTVKVITTDQFQNNLSIGGANVTFQTGNCVNTSLRDWLCPIPSTSSSTTQARIPGFVNKPFTAVANSPSGSQQVYNSSNLFTVLVYTKDELGLFPDMRNGNVTFGSLQCVNNSNSVSETYLWGCSAGWSTYDTVHVLAPGFVNWSSQNVSAPSYSGDQLKVNSANNYTLKITLTDELGFNVSNATITAGNLSQPSCIFRENASYYCAANSSVSSISAGKAGFVNRTATATGMSSLGPQVVLALSNTTSTGLLYSAKIRVSREVSNNNTLMSLGVSFLNLTGLSSIVPAAQYYGASDPNIFYFTFGPGAQEVIVRKSGYVDKLLAFTTSESGQYVQAGTDNKFSVKATVVSENSTNLSSGVTFPSFTYFQNASTPTYFFPLPDATYTISAEKAGFVSTSALAIPNTTYPSNQTEITIVLPYTLKVIVSDWGGSPLNSSSIQVQHSNGTIVDSRNLSSSESVTFFPLNPAQAGIVNVSVSKSGYNTNSFNSLTISSSAQNALNSTHARKVTALVKSWNGTPVSSATIKLFTLSPQSQVATCTTSSLGQCTFNSYNGLLPSGFDGDAFNASTLTEKAIFFTAEKTGFHKVNSTGESFNYTYQGTAPMQGANLSIGGIVTITVRKGWGSASLLEGASVALSNASGQIASATTDSSGTASFRPAYYDSPSPSDTLLTPLEISDLSSYSFNVSKAGYGENSSTRGLNTSTPDSFTITITDNAPPAVTFHSPEESDSFTTNEILGNISVSDPFAPESAGTNYSRIFYRIENSTGYPVRNWQNVCTSLNSSSASCAFSINGLDLPTGTLRFVVNSSDILGNANSSYVSINSRPGYVLSSLEFPRKSAYSNGMDNWLVVFNLTVKGSYAKMQLSNFAGSSGTINITSASCPGSYCARLYYYNSTGCGAAGSQGNLTVRIGNSFAASDTPTEFCDQNLSTSYAREQTVYLNVSIPVNSVADRYNATFGFAGGPLP